MNNIIKLIIILSLLTLHAFASELDLPTQISKSGDKVLLTSTGYAKLGLIKLKTNNKGVINLTGKVSVTGVANLIMWAKVEDKYYFSKMPYLQNINNTDALEFSIPFNSPEKPITELILEVELLNGGKVEIENIKVVNNLN